MENVNTWNTRSTFLPVDWRVCKWLSKTEMITNNKKRYGATTIVTTEMKRKSENIYSLMLDAFES